MQRIVFACLVAIGLGISPTRADVQVATSTQQIPPGKYRSQSFITKFDGEGTWVTSGLDDNSVQGTGRYTIDGDVIAFSNARPSCTNDRARYRLVFEKNGFRLRFLDDACTGIKQLADLVFVRIR